MAKRLQQAACALLGFGLAACGSGGSSTAAPPSPPVVSAPPPASPTSPAGPEFSLARLPDGPHMGVITGFDDLSVGPFDRVARADALQDAAAAAGASIVRIQIDWAELEPAPGVFDADALTDALTAAGARGQLVFVTLSTLDTDALTLPADLLSADGGLRDGLTLANPTVLARFEAFLAWLGPRLGDTVWGISLGNEVDVPIADGLATADDALAFLVAGAAQMAEAAPEIATSVTLTLETANTAPDFTGDLLAVLDLATFNHYCLDGFLQVTREPQWREDVALMKRLAGDLPIMIQELGCPVGFGDDGAGAPPRPANGLMGDAQIQADFFAFHGDLFADDPQFRAATVFQLFDWSPGLADLFGDALRAEGEALFADRLEEWLATVGLCRWADGTCRGAWEVWLEILARQAASRG